MSHVHDRLISLIPRLRRYARLLCADAAAADDLVQDTLERACARIGQWRPGSDLRAWTFTLMHNLFVSETRRPRYRLETAGDAADAAACAADAAILRSSAADPAAGWVAAIDLERALRALPQAQRQVLLLVAFEDMSYEQVATVVGVPVGTVMSRLSRARAHLRELLDPDAGAAPRAALSEPLAAPRLKLMK
ncbi:MAG TPA: sigma-70 family RNA polymerase sigma factor [Burkholderiaceae bacterium]|nr:sigma-70 family RNA polymerase sigma factor [Burkholderiaceae bacterium]